MKSFQDMPLAEELQKALSGLKFVKPTEIQSAVIPVAVEGGDLMACAETGSGKTGAYGIPVVSKLLVETEATALILAPTRELVHQISDFMRELTSHCKNLQVTALVGGADIRKQLHALKRKPRIIVATPGRLTDHLRRKSLSLKNTKTLILDEGDRMLDMGFAPQLDVILKYVPKERQTSLFTATLSHKVKQLAGQYLHKPKELTIGSGSQPVANIKQSVVQVQFKEKDDRIVDELNQREGSVIVFMRTKNRTDILARILSEYGFAVDLIHGGRTQGQRNKAIQNFRKGKTRILCATDIAARGIDVPQVEHVINFDLPMMEEDYVHRIGRTARNGAKGEAVSFVTPEDHRAWQSLARKYKIQGVELVGVKPRKSGRDNDRRRSGRPNGNSGAGNWRSKSGPKEDRDKSRSWKSKSDGGSWKSKSNSNTTSGSWKSKSESRGNDSWNSKSDSRKDGWKSKSSSPKSGGWKSKSQQSEGGWKSKSQSNEGGWKPKSDHSDSKWKKKSDGPAAGEWKSKSDSNDGGWKKKKTELKKGQWKKKSDGPTAGGWKKKSSSKSSGWKKKSDGPSEGGWKKKSATGSPFDKFKKKRKPSPVTRP